jgi:hypothetical protein
VVVAAYVLSHIPCESVYPVYGKVSAKVVDDLPSNGELPNDKGDTVLKTLSAALVTKRLREWDSKKIGLSDDPVVAGLQKERDVPRPVAQKVVKEGRRRVIAEMPSQEGPMNPSLIRQCRMSSSGVRCAAFAKVQVADVMAREKNCSWRGRMPLGPLSTSDMRALVSSPGNKTPRRSTADAGC